MSIWIFSIWLFLLAGALVSLSIAGLRFSKSKKRLSRSIDPINQKAKGLKLELSAIKRSRLDRQRRLESGNSAKTRK